MTFANRYKKNKRKNRLISDINITPFVDVLLVLLIIFMISAPLLTGSVNVDLPKGVTESKYQKEEIIITINSAKKIFIQDQESSFKTLKSDLKKSAKTDEKINVKADKSVSYGDVMEVIKYINDAGFSKVILVTELVE